MKLDPHSFDYNAFGLELFIKLICFFNFIPSHLIFISNLVPILLIAMYLVLNNLSSFFFFFQIQPFTLDFYIRYSTHFFNCDVFGLESLIKLICL